MEPPAGRPRNGKGIGRFFDWLGRRIVRHPWHPIILWIVVLALTLPAAASVGTVISSSFGSVIPSSDQSVVAQNELAAEFPNSSSAPSSALVLLEMPNIMGPVGKNATIALTGALSGDPKLSYIQSVTSLYGAYAGYLTGQAELGLGFLEPALHSTPALPTTVNLTAATLWGPVDDYLQNWEKDASVLPSGTSPSSANWPAYNETETQLASDSTGIRVLATFYNGFNATTPGFNSTVTSGCLESLNITPCADGSARATLLPLVPTLFPGSSNATSAAGILGLLGAENFTCWHCVQATAASLLGAEVGLNPAWIETLWREFPAANPPTPGAVGQWAANVAIAGDPSEYVLPLPPQLQGAFVTAQDSASLIIVSYAVSDDFTANGTLVDYANDAEISHVVSHVVGGSAAFAGISYYVTGGSPIDSSANYLATSTLGILLALTVIVLIVIMIVYFRAPAAPLVTFGLIGIATAVSLGIIFVLGKLVTPFNPEVEPVLLVFLMSIGTDYTVFLMARYREELVQGATSAEAVRTTVRWAGQSITTSALTVMVVAVAMIFGGMSIMAQFGWALVFGVLTCLLVALTVVPSILLLVGPRIFWPNTGARFREYARRRNAMADEGKGFIASAGRTATRRPWAVIGVILLLSAPVVVVALEVPVSYDITNIGLPTSDPAQQGFVQLNHDFGSGYISTSFVLVTFDAPLLSNGHPNVTEFNDTASVASAIASAPGIASVGSLVGGTGPPLVYWESYASLPPAQRAMALESLQTFVGVDGRTVQFQVTTTAGGYTGSAVSAMQSVQGRVSAFASQHPEVATVRYGGAAQTTADLRELVAQTTNGMLIGAAIGLFVILLVILGSAFVPVLALAAIGLSILWAWAGTYFAVGIVQGETLIFLLPMILLIMILGLGMDYNVLLLTRVREERTRGGSSAEAIRRAVTHAGGVIAAAAVILGGAFFLLGVTSPLGMLAGIGLGIGIAVFLQAFVIQTYLTPAILALGKDRIWRGWTRRRAEPAEPVPPERPVTP
jgi:putative drug exporter of the RND superfamily